MRAKLFLVAVLVALALPAARPAEAATITGTGSSCSAAPIDQAFPRTTTGVVNRTVAFRCFMSPTDPALDAARTRITDGNYTGETIAVIVIRTNTSTASFGSSLPATWTNVRWGAMTNSNGSTISPGPGGLPDNYWEGQVTFTANWGSNTATEGAYLIQNPFGFFPNSRNVPAERCEAQYPAVIINWRPYACTQTALPDAGWWTSTTNIDDFGDTFSISACEDVSYGISVNGTAYLMGLSGVSPAPNVGPGDDVLLVVEYPTAGPLSPGSFRWRQTPAYTFAPPLFIDTASVGGASASSYRLPIVAVTDLADIELRCLSSEGDSFRRFGDSGWNASPQINRACSSLRMTMPQGDGSVIQVVDIVASSALPDDDYVGGDVGVSVELRGWNHGEVVSRTRFGAIVGGPVPFTFDIPVGHDGTTTFEDVDIDEPMLGWSYFSVRCTDSQGSLVLDGTGDVYVYDPDSGTWSEADGFGDCLSGSGIGLNPASWVPAVGSMGVCIIRVSVVPSAAAMASRLDRFEALRDEPPIQWADEGATYVVGTDIEFADWATAGPECFDVMDTAVCPRNWTSGVTVPGWVVGVLLFGLWSSLVFAVWRWL